MTDIANVDACADLAHELDPLVDNLFLLIGEAALSSGHISADHLRAGTADLFPWLWHQSVRPVDHRLDPGPAGARLERLQDL